MADIASLGIKIDSSEATGAASNLDKLNAAARRAQGGTDSLEAASKRLALAQRMEALEISKAYGIRQQMTQGQVAAIKNYEMLIGKQALLNRGMAKEAAQHVALRTAGVDANTRYGQTIKTLAGTLHDLEQAQTKTDTSGRSMINTITRRFVVGFLLTQVKDLAAYIWNLNKSLAAVGDTAGRVGMSASRFGAISMTAGNAGLDQGKFQQEFLAFSHGVEEAKKGIGSLGILLRANGLTIKDSADAFFKVADLVKNASSDQAKFSILQQAGLPATREMAKYMEQGGEALKRQAAAAAPLTADLQEASNKADEFDKKWNATWTRWSARGRSAILGIMSGIESIGSAQPGFNEALIRGGSGRPGTTITVNKPDVGFRTNANDFALRSAMAPETGRKTVDPEQEKKLLGVEAQRLGLLGPILTVEQQIAVVENQINTARLNGVGISARQSERLKQFAADSALGIAQIKASTDAHNVEAATVGMSTGQAAAYSAVQTRINEERRKGNELLPQHIAALEREATALGQAASRAETMRWGYESLVRGPMQTFRSSIEAGASGFEALKKAGLSALSKISEKLMDMASQNLWNAAFGGKGGAGGIFASFFGNGGTPQGSAGFGGGGGLAGMNGVELHTGYGPGDAMRGRYIHPAHFNDAPRFHSGIGPHERAAVIRKDESVLTPGQMRALAPVGGGQPIVINNSYDMRGADPGLEARMKRYVDDSSKRTMEAVQSFRNANPTQRDKR